MEQEEIMFYVYSYLREDLTPYYIGKGTGKRAWSKRHNVNVPDDTRIIILAENLTEKEAFELEVKLIKEYGRKDLGNGILRNRTDGGEGISGPKSDSHKKGISKALKGKPKSAEHCRKLSEAGKNQIPWNKGLNKDDQRVAKYSESLKGKIFSDEHRANLSKSHKGIPNTPEQKAKISAKLKGRKFSEETLNKMRQKKGPQQTTTCPHCGKTGGLAGMRRYHFDNCNLK